LHTKRLLALVIGLWAAFASVSAARAEDVLVFAAASLTNALNEVGQQFAANTGNRMVASYAASSALAKQIEQGAPANLFASADLQWMDYLAERKLIDPASRSDLLGNTLVLIAPADSQQSAIDLAANPDLAALAGDGRIATGNPAAVPVGLYFKQAMERSGQWAKVEPKLARTESVRAALALVERGEVPLGVVYATDAAISPKVKVVGTFPAARHDPIVYPFALVAGRDSAAARSLVAFLKSGAAKAVFRRYGFTTN
jgi:molybdate transport system substrate-binding protein